MLQKRSSVMLRTLISNENVQIQHLSKPLLYYRLDFVHSIDSVHIEEDKKQLSKTSRSTELLILTIIN